MRPKPFTPAWRDSVIAPMKAPTPAAACRIPRASGCPPGGANPKIGFHRALLAKTGSRTMEGIDVKLHAARNSRRPEPGAALTY